MKTITELRKELENAKLKREHYEGLQEANRLKKEIFRTNHPRLINAGMKLKKVGSSAGKNLRGMGKQVYEATKSQAQEIKKSQVKRGYHSNNILRSKIKGRKVDRQHIRTKRPKLKVRHINHVQRVNPYNPFGLDF